MLRQETETMAQGFASGDPPTTLGDLISVLYDDFMDVFGDEELASLATATTIEKLLNDRANSIDPNLFEEC